jgi:nucleotide-binding universal stress UspA family protein
MRDHGSALAVVVGIDGSPTATQAALWAVDEAVSRDISLRLVHVIDTADLARTGTDRIHLASARAALYDARRTVEATGKPVKIETEILWGSPLVKLREESRSAAMVCIGSIGMTHACRGDGSVARALPGLVRCPVVVVRRQGRRSVTPDVGSIVVEMGNDVALRHAFEEAGLREAPLRAIALWRAEAPDDIADGSRLAQAQLNRRIARWRRMYPDVVVDTVAVHGDVCQYLAAIGESIQLYITGVHSHQPDLGRPRPVGCSVLTVRANHL